MKKRKRTAATKREKPVPPEYATYRQQLVKCGKRACKRCKKRPAHGPYWFAEWKESVTVTTKKTPRSAAVTRYRLKLRTAYVGKTLPPEVAARFASWAPSAFGNKNWAAVQAAAAKEVEVRAIGGRRIVKVERSKTSIPRGLWRVELECGHPHARVYRGKPRVTDSMICPTCVRESR